MRKPRTIRFGIDSGFPARPISSASSTVRFRPSTAGRTVCDSYAEHATSRVLTLYTGFQITKNLEILADVEKARAEPA